MQRILMHPDGGRPLRILCLGAHSDDLEIGCGGAVLKLTQEPRRADVFWVVFSGDERRAGEARAGADLFLRCAAWRTVELRQYRESFFPMAAPEIKEEIREIKERFSPDIVFTHRRNDLHQDHRTLAELTWNEFRDHLILEFEIPKYDGDLGAPNVFFQLDEELCRRKVDYIWETFESQRTRQWFTPDTFHGLMRLRGLECNSPTKYAEGFYSRKLVF